MAPTLQPYKGGFYLWHYIPSLPLAVVFAVLFAAMTLANAWRMSRARAWYCSALVVGGCFEVVGYIARAFCTYNTGSLIPFIIEAIFLLVPPILFAATLYTVYDRVVRAVPGGADISLLSPRRATVIFVSSDIFTFLVQSEGASMQAKASQAVTGARIVIGGLILQIVMFALFIAMCGHFNIRIRARLGVGSSSAFFIPPGGDKRIELPSRDGLEEPADEGASGGPVRWQACLYMLYATSLAILVRNIYRMAEFISLIGNTTSYLNKNEWPAYVFDGVLMLVVMASFWNWFPSRLLRS